MRHLFLFMLVLGAPISIFGATYFNCELAVQAPFGSNAETIRYTVLSKSYLKKQGSTDTARFEVQIKDLDVKIQADLYQWTSIRQWLSVGEKTYRFDAAKFGRIHFPLTGNISQETLRNWERNAPEKDIEVKAVELECSITKTARYPDHLEIIE